MKSAVTNVLFVVLLLFGKSELQAGNSSIITKIDHAGAQNIALYVEFPKPASVQLHIRSEDGGVVFRGTYPDVSIFARKINLSSLPQGTYYIEVEGPQKIHIHRVMLSADELLIAGGKPAVIFKPAFRVKGNFVDVTMFLPDNMAATIKIYGPDNSLVLSQKVKNMRTLEKRFDISRLPAGMYEVIVSTEERTFNYTFFVQ